MKLKFMVANMGCIMMLWFTMPPVQADLVIWSPEDMIDRSSTIQVGKITERELTDDMQRLKVEVEMVLKGTNVISEFEWNRSHMSVRSDEQIPEIGTKVLLLLSGDQLTGDANAIGIVDGSDGVAVSDGLATSSYIIEDYNEAYGKLLQSLPKVSDQPRYWILTVMLIAAGVVAWKTWQNRDEMS